MQDRIKDKKTLALYEGTNVKGLSPDIRRKAKIKIFIALSAKKIDDLKIPPGNRLEKLKGDRDDQFSIRVNNRYRICFSWKDDGAFDIEFIDYH
jgi:proteic killer suppression protein